MHILFLANADSPNTLEWANYFADHFKHKITIISFQKPPSFEHSLDIIYIKPKKYFFKFNYILNIPRVKNIVHRINPDLIIGYRIISYGFIGAFINFKPLVLAAQGQNIVSTRHMWLNKIFVNYAIKRADLINSWGEHMTKKLIQLGAEKDSILTLPRGVQSIFFLTNKITDNKSKYTIISTRTLRKDYNIDIAIKAMFHLKKMDYNFKFLVVGDGPYRENLEYLSRNLGLQKEVKFIGKLPYHYLPRALMESDIYISCVSTDGVSSSLLEAMAAKNYPIVVDNSANRQWIEHNNNGLLYRNNDLNDLVEKMAFAMNNWENTRTKLDFNYQLVFNKANWTENMRLIETKYNSLLKEINE